MSKVYAERIAVLAVALFVMALGVALCVRSSMGITPISCPPYVLSLGFAPTIGTFTIAMHGFFILLQVILLRSEFKKTQLLQIFVALAFGLFVDLAMELTAWIDVTSYVSRLSLLLLSCMVIAVGVVAQVKSRSIYVPGEGIMLAIAHVTGRPFNKIKIYFDCGLLLTGSIISLILFREFRGISEGSIISAVMVGIFVGFIRPHLSFIDRFLTKETITA